VVLLDPAQGQGGFFGGIGNLIRGFVGRPRRPQATRGAGRPAQSVQSSGPCPSSGPNHGQYLVSWRLGCTSFTASQGAAYCRSNGMQPVSLDTPQKERELGQLLVREGQPYFWTGGRVNHRARSVTWPSGATTTRHNWSRGQPNNAEGNENCLAIIVKGTPGFNDVACSHTKPIICQ